MDAFLRPIPAGSGSGALDPFTEALAVVPMVHLPVQPGQAVLLDGQGAAAAADVVLRYPTTASVVIVGDQVPIPAARDRRVQVAPSLDQVPAPWKADLSIVVIPAITDALVSSIAARQRSTSSITVFAVANPGNLKQARLLVASRWSYVRPYREHLPSGVAWFILASGRPVQRERPMPGWTGRITDNYLPALFTFAKDEYVAAYGGGS